VQQPFVAGKILPLHSCRATAVAELAGRSHVMAVEFPSATAVPKHHFVFEDRCLRDAFIQRVQVRYNNHNHNQNLIIIIMKLIFTIIVNIMTTIIITITQSQ
jgi:hypothetical protein